MAGWRISSGSSALTASKSSGGESTVALVRDEPILNAHDASLYNNIVPPSQLPQKANYYLFKVCLDDQLPLSKVTDALLRTGSSLLGKTMQIRVVVNGAFSFQKIRTGAMSTRCGCIRCVVEWLSVIHC
jgi:hypothetical protein